MPRACCNSAATLLLVLQRPIITCSCVGKSMQNVHTSAVGVSNDGVSALLLLSWYLVCDLEVDVVLVRLVCCGLPPCSLLLIPGSRYSRRYYRSCLSRLHGLLSLFLLLLSFCRPPSNGLFSPPLVIPGSPKTTACCCCNRQAWDFLLVFERKVHSALTRGIV